MIDALFAHHIGSFAVPYGTPGEPRALRIHYARPSCDVRRAAIVIALHGVDRAASAFRDVLAARAAHNGQLVLAPEFDLERFPDIHAYNFGGVRAPPPDGSLRARGQWTFRIVDHVFAFVRRSIGSEQTGFSLFGNSAGAQFVLRYMALNEAPSVTAAVAANSGVFMLPDMSLDYPAGMGGIGLGEDALARYLTRPLTIMIGERDTDPDAPGLPRGQLAEAQGPHRLARARWYLAHCSDLARSLGMTLGWRYELVPDAGHVSQAIYDRALDILAAGRALEPAAKPR